MAATSETASTKRYTAMVEIFEVTETPETVTGYNRDKIVPSEKSSREVIKIVVRDPDLESLKAKLQSHIELVD